MLALRNANVIVKGLWSSEVPQQRLPAIFVFPPTREMRK
jgi:hypothetical protein